MHSFRVKNGNSDGDDNSALEALSVNRPLAVSSATADPKSGPATKTKKPINSPPPPIASEANLKVLELAWVVRQNWPAYHF